MFFVSSESNPAVKKRFAEAFSKVNRNFKKLDVRSLSPLKKQTARTEEKIEASQAKTIIAYKSDTDDNNGNIDLTGIQKNLSELGIRVQI